MKSIMLLIPLVLAGCSAFSAAAKPALITIGTDICTQAVDQALDASPDWVTLACKDAAGNIVNIIMPRRAWYEAKHLGLDAGK